MELTGTLEGLKRRWDGWWRGSDLQGRKRQRRRLALLLGSALILYWIFGGDQGLFALASTWHERWALKQEIASLRDENQALIAEQEALRHDHSYYEKIAREKLLLKNPGDLIYRFDGT